jgi:hypothetical protein
MHDIVFVTLFEQTLTVFYKSLNFYNKVALQTKRQAKGNILSIVREGGGVRAGTRCPDCVLLSTK